MSRATSPKTPLVVVGIVNPDYTSTELEDPFGAELGIPLYNDGSASSSSKASRKFVLHGYKDVWAAVLFILFALALIVAGSYNLKTNFDVVKAGTNSWGDFHPATYFQWAGIGTAIGFVIAVLSLGVFYVAPRVSIIGINALVVAMLFGLGVFNITNGSYSGAACMVTVAVLRLAVVFYYRKQIPLSGLILSQAIVISKRHPMMIILAILTFLFNIVLCSFAFATVYPIVSAAWDDSNANKPSDAAISGLCTFFIFACYWINQVSFNVGHTANCGVTAVWYFCGQDAMPQNPTLHSAKRALTTSFGSVCLGSILVAVVRCLDYLIRCFARKQGFLACVTSCCLGCAERLLKMFNHYAFVYIAIYGCGFMEGARKTISLVSASPYLILFNRLMIGGMLLMFTLVISIATGVVAFYITKGQQDTTISDDWMGYSLIFSFISAISCSLAMSQIYRSIDSASTTLLVCLSEEPQLIYTTNPEFASELASKAAAAGIKGAAETSMVPRQELLA